MMSRRCSRPPIVPKDAKVEMVVMLGAHNVGEEQEEGRDRVDNHGIHPP